MASGLAALSGFQINRNHTQTRSNRKVAWAGVATERRELPGNRGFHPELQLNDRVVVRLFFSGESRQQKPIEISPEIQFWIDHRNEAEKAQEALQWFRDGSITEKSDEELTVISSILTTLPVPNPEARHIPIIQAMTINHIQMLRYVQKSDAQAQKLSKESLRVTWIVGWLAAVTTLAAIVQTVALFHPFNR